MFNRCYCCDCDASANLKSMDEKELLYTLIDTSTHFGTKHALYAMNNGSVSDDELDKISARVEEVRAEILSRMCVPDKCEYCNLAYLTSIGKI